MKYTRTTLNNLVKDVTKYFETYPAGIVEVTRGVTRRSAEQQGLIHIVMRQIAAEVGVSAEHFKQDIVKRDSAGVYPHWPQEQGVGMNGEIVFTPKSENRLSKKEESEQIEHLNALAIEWGIELEAA